MRALPIIWKRTRTWPLTDESVRRDIFVRALSRAPCMTVITARKHRCGSEIPKQRLESTLTYVFRDRGIGHMIYVLNVRCPFRLLAASPYSPRPRKFKGSEGNSSVSDSQNCSPLIIFHAYARKKQYGDFRSVPL